MLRRQRPGCARRSLMAKPGWTSREIRALFDEIVEELSLIAEGQHNEHMVDITEDTDQVIPMTDRISERYTAAHIRHYSESTNEDFAEDMLKHGEIQ